MLFQGIRYRSKFKKKKIIEEENK